MNARLAGVFPQFETGERLGNDSSAQTVERVRDYLVAALNGKLTADGDIAIKGKQQTILRRVRALQAAIEGFVNNMPKVAKALRNNTPLYLPYATFKQLEKIKTTAAKIKVMREVMDNFQYNSEFDALNSIKQEKPEQFAQSKKEWEKKVGYRRLKRV